jgi:acyl-CoA thioester hydrolase
MGHMNVMWYVSKFDEAIWNLFASVGLTPSYLRESGRGMAAVEQRIRYLRELVAGDVVAVRSEITAVREKVIEVRQTLVNLEDRAVAATMDLVGVHLDTVARRSVPFETRIAERARALLAAAPEVAVRR